ncbi:MAG: hypothetical protein EBT48_01715 [Verrucomicrobia bacterium]|nr:hypothetical protein [Verrucomicrobiota bacterium]
MNPRQAVSFLCYHLGDIWSKTHLFQWYGLGYGFYTRLMELSLEFDDKQKIWKKPDTQAVAKSRRRRALKLNKKRK